MGKTLYSSINPSIHLYINTYITIFSFVHLGTISYVIVLVHEKPPCEPLGACQSWGWSCGWGLGMPQKITTICGLETGNPHQLDHRQVCYDLVKSELADTHETRSILSFVEIESDTT